MLFGVTGGHLIPGPEGDTKGEQGEPQFLPHIGTHKLSVGPRMNENTKEPGKRSMKKMHLKTQDLEREWLSCVLLSPAMPFL